MASSLPEYKILHGFQGRWRNKRHHADEPPDGICEGLHQIFPDKSAKDLRQHISERQTAEESEAQSSIHDDISYIEYKEAKKLPVFNLSKFKGGFHELGLNQRKKPFGSLAAR